VGQLLCIILNGIFVHTVYVHQYLLLYVTVCVCVCVHFLSQYGDRGVQETYAATATCLGSPGVQCATATGVGDYGVHVGVGYAPVANKVCWSIIVVPRRVFPDFTFECRVRLLLYILCPFGFELCPNLKTKSGSMLIC